jgi:hypothetical protein
VNAGDVHDFTSHEDALFMWQTDVGFVVKGTVIKLDGPSLACLLILRWQATLLLRRMSRILP